MSKDVQVVSGKMKMISNEDTKRRLVLESYQSGQSLNRFAKENGISPASLCQWRKRYPIEGFEAGSAEDIGTLRAENEALKRELFKMKAYLGHKIYELDAPRFG